MAKSGNQIQVGSSSLNNKCSHREAVGVGLAYMCINKMALYGVFCALRKHSDVYRNVHVVSILRGVGSTRLLPLFCLNTHLINI